MTPQIGVVMTCHNRRETTVRCLSALRDQAGVDAEVRLFVTDDGSNDGTAEGIREVWPEATIIPGTGSLYWAAGMALAERAAVQTRSGYLLWLNDDTVLDSDAVARLLHASAEHPEAIIVGATVDPETGERTYGGRLRPGAHPQRLPPVPLAEIAQRADTFNGNVVLIPWEARQRIGPIDGLFPHAYADDDYGLRASALGVAIIQAPGAVGACSRNTVGGSPPGGPLDRWRRLQSPTGLPWRAQARYLRRHGEWWWPAILVGQQVKTLAGR